MRDSRKVSSAPSKKPLSAYTADVPSGARESGFNGWIDLDYLGKRRLSDSANGPEWTNSCPKVIGFGNGS
jgi:hypothetical protein